MDVIPDPAAERFTLVFANRDEARRYSLYAAPLLDRLLNRDPEAMARETQADYPFEYSVRARSLGRAVGRIERKVNKLEGLLERPRVDVVELSSELNALHIMKDIIGFYRPERM